MISVSTGKISRPARNVFTLARQEALKFKHQYIATEHILLGLILEESCIASRLLRDLGVDYARVRKIIEDIVGIGQGSPNSSLPLTPRIKRVIDLAINEAWQLGQPKLETEHLLLGLIREGDGIAINVLKVLDINPEIVGDRVLRAMLDSSPNLRIPVEFSEQLKNVLSPGKIVESNGIFIVHGHDEAAKESVARFIERSGAKPIILHEQPNAGKTIIEKFEDNSDVGFAVVLLTPDDIGAPKEKKDQPRLRARQNVILELGYFMGKLGRGRVCALYKEGVEIPSDYQGVLYIPMDSAGAWRMALAKEIKNADIEIDLNKAL